MWNDLQSGGNDSEEGLPGPLWRLNSGGGHQAMTAFSCALHLKSGSVKNMESWGLICIKKPLKIVEWILGHHCQGGVSRPADKFWRVLTRRCHSCYSGDYWMRTERGVNPRRSRRCNRRRIPVVHCSVKNGREGREEVNPEARRRVSNHGVN